MSEAYPYLAAPLKVGFMPGYDHRGGAQHGHPRTGLAPVAYGHSAQRPGVEVLPGAELAHVRTVFDVFDDSASVSCSSTRIRISPGSSSLSVSRISAAPSRS